MQHQQAEITWTEDRVPVSVRFDDPYFSLEDGLAETGHVFLAGNGLPARLRPGFTIAELGFGTGLNMLAACRMWAAAGSPAPLHLVSFEAYPMAPDDMARALDRFAGLEPWRARLLAAWDGRGGAMTLAPGVTLTVVAGDARQTVAAWTGRADAWFLDGFSPARNPEMWQADLMAEVSRHTVPGGTAATYSAAGFVRRNLSAAGFDVVRAPGYGRKRHMTQARKPE